MGTAEANWNSHLEAVAVKLQKNPFDYIQIVSRIIKKLGCSQMDFFITLLQRLQMTVPICLHCSQLPLNTVSEEVRDTNIKNWQKRNKKYVKMSSLGRCKRLPSTIFFLFPLLPWGHWFLPSSATALVTLSRAHKSH